MQSLSPFDLSAEILPIGITSLSLGRAGVHRMEDKVKAAAEAGFKGVEIFFEDLEDLAHELHGDEDIEISLRHAAHLIHCICDSFGITIINLQPFRDYEGLISKTHHEGKISELKNWLVLCKILRTDMIVVTSVFPSASPTTTGNEENITKDLRELADLGAREEPPIRFAYEAISWGAHVNTWQRAWKVVQKVNRPNLGLCLDTFHILAKVWADPESTTGRRHDSVEALRRDLQELVSAVNANRLFSVQLADATKLDPPLSPQYEWSDPSQHPLMMWSRQARLFPLEDEMGAYLPVLAILQACVVDIGYRGWISMEVFNRSLFARDRRVPFMHAQRGMKAWEKCKNAIANEVEAKSED